jgi:hypothetical protein
MDQEKVTEIQEFHPREEDHIVCHYTETISHPMMSRVWKQSYAEEIAKFITGNGAESTPLAQRAISQLVLSPDWTKGMDVTVLNDLHLAEAEARGITPLTMQKILWMQESLYNNGVDPDSVVSQRTQILERLGEMHDGPAGLEEIGEKVHGLVLCINEVWNLKDYSPETAGQLQDQVTARFGRRYYQSGLMFDMGSRTGDSDMQRRAQQLGNEVFSQAIQFKMDFIHSLPPEINKTYFDNFLKGNFNAIKRSLTENFVRVRENIDRGLGVLKARLSKNQS